MDKRQTEVYEYYKMLYPGYLVLYHVGEFYIALGDDATRVAGAFDRDEPITEECWIPYDSVDIISRLGNISRLKMIDYRNEDGEYDFPDIERLKQEESEDY